jgi:hypothetical protein
MRVNGAWALAASCSMMVRNEREEEGVFCKLEMHVWDPPQDRGVRGLHATSGQRKRRTGLRYYYDHYYSCTVDDY